MLIDLNRLIRQQTVTDRVRLVSSDIVGVRRVPYCWSGSVQSTGRF